MQHQTQSEPRAVARAEGGLRGANSCFSFFSRELSFEAFDAHPLAVEPGTASDVLQRIEARFHSEESGYLVGALPFDVERSSASLWIAPHVRWRGPSRHRGATQAAIVVPSGVSTMECTREQQQAFEQAVASGVAHISESHRLHKVVLARSLAVQTSTTYCPDQILTALRDMQGDAYCFSLRDSATQKLWMGATPELLVSRRGLQVCSHPLAGSRPRSADPDEDCRRATELLASGKDRYEHALVVQAIQDHLQPLCRALHVPSEPALVATSNMWHLGTRIEGTLHSTRTTALKLALLLHPTPAVCGYPLAPAQAYLREHERLVRGLYTGAVGWCDQHGDGQWAVTIRCAEIDRKEARIFAGVGVVAQSNPQDEFLETQAKMQMMLRALRAGTKGVISCVDV